MTSSYWNYNYFERTKNQKQYKYKNITFSLANCEPLNAVRGRLSSLVFADDVELGELAFSPGLPVALAEPVTALLLVFGVFGFLTRGPVIKTKTNEKRKKNIIKHC